MLLDRTLDQTLDRTLDRTLGGTLGRTLDRTLDRTLGRTLDRTLGRTLGVVAPWVERSLRLGVRITCSQPTVIGRHLQKLKFHHELPTS